MGRQNIAFLQTPTSGTKCANVSITPNFGTTPRIVNMVTTQTFGHIFYTLSHVGPIPPTHTGDTATGTTIRVGTNHATISTGTGVVDIAAICYQAGFLDSDITYAGFDPPEPPG